MNILWAPWRMEYIENADEYDGCIFCEKPKEDRDEENLIVYRGKTAFVMMNRYPYNNGHLMVVPYQHTDELNALSREQKIELFDLLILSKEKLIKVMKPQGFNIGMNIGRIAGAGIVDHLHFHIVPRWSGDTNFMPIVGHTKVVSEGLVETLKKLRKAFQNSS
ncbi:HIT domain-containing protein [bacterium]|nr:HIT domain-containing protein [bacterium]RQV95057.1 MAG: HIT domain-containing protein [bacterium]